MTMKIAVSSEYDHGKRHFYSNRLILVLLQKLLTALSDTFFNLWRLCPRLIIAFLNDNSLCVHICMSYINRVSVYTNV